MFMAMPLGRLWHARFGVPCVLDMQDPWVSDYYDTHPDATPPRLTAWRSRCTTARTVHDGASAASSRSQRRIKTLRRRYRGIDIGCCADPVRRVAGGFDLLDRRNSPAGFSSDGAGTIGVCGPRRRRHKAAARLLFGALERGLAIAPALFEPIRSSFVGTDTRTHPCANDRTDRSGGPRRRVHEQTARVPC
jgi:hypothetical protein